jgi:hypothetical protein
MVSPDIPFGIAGLARLEPGGLGRLLVPDLVISAFRLLAGGGTFGFLSDGRGHPRPTIGRPLMVPASRRAPLQSGQPKTALSVQRGLAGQTLLAFERDIDLFGIELERVANAVGLMRSDQGGPAASEGSRTISPRAVQSLIASATMATG